MHRMCYKMQLLKLNLDISGREKNSHSTLKLLIFFLLSMTKTFIIDPFYTLFKIEQPTAGKSFSTSKLFTPNTRSTSKQEFLRLF